MIKSTIFNIYSELFEGNRNLRLGDYEACIFYKYKYLQGNTKKRTFPAVTVNNGYSRYVARLF